jgi:hypothetical protein
LLARRDTADALRKIQHRRTFPTVVTQKLQVFIQNRLLSHVLSSQAPLKLPLILRWVARWSWPKRIPARIVGVGVRPEHVQTEEASSK